MMTAHPTAAQHVCPERLPWPIGLAWVSAQRAKQAQGVFGAAEVTLRVLFALVLTDVLDLAWPEELAGRLRDTTDGRGLGRSCSSAGARWVPRGG